MARCDVPGAQCLTWHVLDHLHDPKPSGQVLNGIVQSYRAECPLHGGQNFSVSVGRNGRVVWRCHTTDSSGEPVCSQLDLRAALIRRGVPAECLLVPRDEGQEVIDQIVKLYATAMHRAERQWRIFSLVHGFGGELPPKGRYLGGRRQFARDAGVSAPDLYRHFNR